jgi:hypothetical protein
VGVDLVLDAGLREWQLEVTFEHGVRHGTECVMARIQ